MFGFRSGIEPEPSTKLDEHLPKLTYRQPAKKGVLTD